MSGNALVTREILGDDRLREFSRGRGEPSWLTDWRVRSGRVYQSAPLPHRAAHLWRYTDPALFQLEETPAFLEAKAAPRPDAGDRSEQFELLRGGGDLSGAALAVDGRLLRAELSPELSRAGVLLMDLDTAVREQPDLLRRILGALVGPDFGRLEALNSAVFSGGILLHVPRGVTVEKPLHLAEHFSAAGVQASRLAVLLEEGSTLTLIDELTSDPSLEGTLFHVAELEAGPGSNLSLATIQTLSRSVRLAQTQRARLLRSAAYTPVLASFGGSLAKVDTGAVLEGEDSRSEMTGFVSAVSRQRFDHHTVHHHVGRRTQSNLDFKTVLKDRARSAYTGLIRIEEAASFSEAYQENRNLLLSEQCRADSIPELEILTEEVQCKHGATAGPISPEHLFYLMSRGIDEGEATRMIVEGHFESALVRLPAALGDRLRRLLWERLAG